MGEHGYSRKHEYGHDHGHGYDGGHGHHGTAVAEVLKRLLANKALLAFIAVLALLAVGLGIWLIVALLPVAGTLVDALLKSGVKGFVEQALSLLRRLWEGAGGGTA